MLALGNPAQLAFPSQVITLKSVEFIFPVASSVMDVIVTTTAVIYYVIFWYLECFPKTAVIAPVSGCFGPSGERLSVFFVGQAFQPDVWTFGDDRSGWKA